MYCIIGVAFRLRMQRHRSHVMNAWVLLTETWIAVPQDPYFKGLYDQSRQCPSWASGHNCQVEATQNQDKLGKEYNEVRYMPETALHK